MIAPWVPRVGDTGDDRYRWPATARFSAGPHAFSIPPTMAQYLPSTGLNQILADYNLRAHHIGRVKPGNQALGQVGYFAPDNRVGPSAFNSLRTTLVDQLRAALGEPEFAWSGGTWEAGQRWPNVTEIRKSLDVPFAIGASLSLDRGALRAGPGGLWPDTGVTGVLGADLFAETVVGLETRIVAGIREVSAEPGVEIYEIYRAFLTFDIPAGLPAPSSARLRVPFEGTPNVGVHNIFAPFDLGLWVTTNWGALGAEDFDFSGSQFGALGVATATHVAVEEFEIPPSAIVPGSPLKLALAHTGERGGAPPPTDAISTIQFLPRTTLLLLEF
ncbi:MAG: hypothetical protein AMXMBFR7_32910 [Planctomycetota bacterium]